MKLKKIETTEIIDKYFYILKVFIGNENKYLNLTRVLQITRKLILYFALALFTIECVDTMIVNAGTFSTFFTYSLIVIVANSLYDVLKK